MWTIELHIGPYRRITLYARTKDTADMFTRNVINGKAVEIFPGSKYLPTWGKFIDYPDCAVTKRVTVKGVTKIIKGKTYGT